MKLMTARLAFIAVLAIGSPGGALAEGPVHGGSLTMLVQPEPATLGIQFSAGAQTTMVAAKVVEGLLDYNSDMEPQPLLAESWEVAADGLSYTFKLRPNVSWHDGKPFTSADVKFSLEMLSKTHPRYKGNFGSIKAVETPDDLTVVFVMTEPSPILLKVLSVEEAPILPKHVFEGTDYRENPANQKPVGTGPFKFGEWVRGQSVILEKNENYWDKGKPYLDRVVVRFIADAATRAAELENGGAHVSTPGSLSTIDIQRFGSMKDFAVQTEGTKPYAPMMFLELNTRREPLNKPEVRKAIMHAIDRQFILDNIWFGIGKVATGPIPSSFAEYYEPNVTAYPYDPALSKKLLDDAGLKPGSDGFRFKITHDVSPVSEDWRRMGEYLRQALREVGIDVVLRQEDRPSFLRRIYTENDFDMSSNSFISLADPTSGIQRVYWSKNIRPGVTFSNASGYSNPLVDSLWEQAAKEMDPAKRADLFKQVQREITKDVPVVWLLEEQYVTVSSKKVKDLLVNPFGVRSSFANTWLEK